MNPPNYTSNVLNSLPIFGQRGPPESKPRKRLLNPKATCGVKIEERFVPSITNSPIPNFW